jgi:hypothetical protein
MVVRASSSTRREIGRLLRSAPRLLTQGPYTYRLVAQQQHAGGNNWETLSSERYFALFQNGHFSVRAYNHICPVLGTRGILAWCRQVSQSRMHVTSFAVCHIQDTHAYTYKTLPQHATCNMMHDATFMQHYGPLSSISDLRSQISDLRSQISVYRLQTTGRTKDKDKA